MAPKRPPIPPSERQRLLNARLFGELRAILNSSEADPQRAQQMGKLLGKCCGLHPQQLNQQWEPYLRAAPNLPVTELHAVGSLQSIPVRFRPLLPIRLNCANRPIGPGGLSKLRREGLEHIHELDLSRNGIGPHILRTLLWDELPQLRRLNYGQNHVGLTGCQHLATTRSLPSIEHLELYSTSLRDAEIEALVQSSFWPQLRRLDLGNRGRYRGRYTRHFVTEPNDIDQRALNAIASRAQQLEELRLEDTLWPPPVALGRLASGLHAIRRLSLSGNNITSAMLAPFLENLPTDTLQELDLSRNQLDEDAVDLLLESPRLARLQRLDLSTNHLRSEDIERLQSARRFAQLELRSNLHDMRIMVHCRTCRTLFPISHAEYRKTLEVYGPLRPDDRFESRHPHLRRRCDLCQPAHQAQRRIGQLRQERGESLYAEHHRELARCFTILDNPMRANYHNNRASELEQTQG